MELDEDFGVVGGVTRWDDVVVNLRVAVPHVGEPALHGGHLCQAAFDEAQGAIRLRITGAVGRLDGYEELRCIGFRKQAAADDRNQQCGEQHRGSEGCCYSGLGSAQAIVQRRAIVAVNRVHHPAQERAAVRVRMLAQQAAGEKRDDEHCDQQGPDDRCDHGDRQHADELSGVTWKGHQGQERKDQRGGAAQDGDEDLPCPCQGGFDTRCALPQVS